jgi:hypothetical protein
MGLYRPLYEIAKLLLKEDQTQTAEILLERVLAAVGAERGFIVVREGDRYVQKCQVRFDRGSVTRDGLKFSRSLVRQAIESGELISSPNLSEDPASPRTRAFKPSATAPCSRRLYNTTRRCSGSCTWSAANASTCSPTRSNGAGLPPGHRTGAGRRPAAAGACTSGDSRPAGVP